MSPKSTPVQLSNKKMITADKNKLCNINVNLTFLLTERENIKF